LAKSDFMSVPTEIAPEPPRLGDEPQTGERFLRSQRLLRRAEFVRVQSKGRRVHTAHFVLLMLRSAAPGPRLGVTVGKRVGGAVQRNRIKRLCREVFRRNQRLFPRDCALVLVARQGADRLDYASVLGELQRAQSAIERAHKQLRAEEPPGNGSV
jgi:ribonuclease P protein component